MRRDIDTVVRFALAVLVTAAVLRVADAVPGAVSGLPRGVVRVASLAQLAAPNGPPVVMPPYYPDTLGWPPAELRRYPGGSTLVTLAQRATRQPWMLMACATTMDERLGLQVIPETTLLQDTDATVDGTAVRLQRVQDRAGAVWHQTLWEADGCARTVRYRGPLEDLLRVTGTLRAGGLR